ncbi:MAG: tRNA pseudouridine(13) synthase TruD [Candidatus Thermoplasmatota archaeon]|jgi:tRNA pseudouridine13 synthase|nr:tRNA pseudouridine(13) synthase TruD [Candidatus Thermoplasmatota archaeon]
MKSSNIEKNIGIETFFSPYAGTGGKLRTTPDDFLVKEISNYPPAKEKGDYVVAEVTTINWETNTLIKEISDRLRISRNRISFAGTKDKRAKTTRLMSFYKIEKEKLSGIKIKDVSLDNIYYSDQKVKIGDLLGNRFEVIIRNIEPDIKTNHIQNIVSFIEEKGGFPNFYGVQRFGTIRPITHIVGKHIICNDFKKAVMTYVAKPIVGEDEKNYKLRERLQKTNDFSEALASYPDELNFEKAILNRLVVNPDDFVGALTQLPKNLLTMFIYAYQSYLFNKILSERIRRKLSINKAVVGDIILPVRNNVIDENELILVTESNIEKVNKQVAKGKAFVSGLLLGCDSRFSSGEMGEIEHKIVEEEKIDPRDFIIPEMPFLSSSGSRRPLLAPVNNLDFELMKDDFNKDKLALKLKFELRKGSYATSLLREFMKSEDIRNY